MKEAPVFSLLIMRVILVHIFSPRKDEACCLEFPFHSCISNAFCDVVLNLLYKGLNISLIYDGTIPFQYLKTVVAMQILLFEKLGANLFFEDELHLCVSEGVNPNKEVCIYFVLSVVCVLDFY